MSSTLPPDVVAKDHDLEDRSKRTTEALAKYRWHWTLDETNPKRVSIREYAKSVGRSHPTILAHVNAYVAFLDGKAGRARPTTLTEAIERQGKSEEQAAAAEAVAKARGLSLATVRNANHRKEVREVRAVAEERAERKGTTVAEEVEAVAEWRVKAEKAKAKQREDAAANAYGAAYFEVEGMLQKALRELRPALTLVRDTRWSDEDMELLRHDIGRVKALVGLLELAVGDVPHVDWDEEFVKMTGGTRG